MKTFILLLFVSVVPPAVAQGALQFRANLVPIPSAPAETPSLDAGFYSGSDFFTGNVSYYFTTLPSDIRFAQIEFSNGNLVPGLNATTFLDGTVGGTTQSFVTSEWFSGGLSGEQAAQLLAGEWYVSVALSSSPDAIIRGQLQLVPEPSPWAVMMAGGCFMFWKMRTKLFLQETVKILLLCCFWFPSLFAQGTIKFRAHLLPDRTDAPDLSPGSSHWVRWNFAPTMCQFRP